MTKQNLTKKETELIKAKYLVNSNIEKMLEMAMISKTKGQFVIEPDFNYNLLKSGETVLEKLVDLIFARPDNNKYSKYNYYNVKNVKEYCLGWYFDCIHDCPERYYFNDIIRLIKDMINGVLEYPKADKAFKKTK